MNLKSQESNLRIASGLLYCTWHKRVKLKNLLEYDHAEPLHGTMKCTRVLMCNPVCLIHVWYVFMWPLLQDHRFSDEIDKLTGYKTQSILCKAICNSDGEVIGVVQAINKNPMGTPFTEDDEKVRLCYVSQLKKTNKHSSDPCYQHFTVTYYYY